MSALHKGGTFKPPIPGVEHVDIINEDLNDITEQELEQQEVQNLLTTPEPIRDVQLQLVGYKQEKDDKGKKRSLNISPITPKRIKSRKQTPKHLSLAIAVRHATGSARIINILNGLGHSISHSAVLEYDTELAEMQLNCVDCLLLRIISSKFATFVWDNIDL
ncbi:hypothetical protein AVEN_97615-1 [Araneus ventricosus]|uniref:Uncharacterized protein n=1 Tax=Araneus ventricosus TaxID=182803 RepID=A0A4Y2GFK1_ARAVE|nr:hypothetical protein AVEN_97615-1 [Araneus ventricosus]